MKAAAGALLTAGAGWLVGTPKAMLRQYERDMAEVLKAPERNPEAAVGLAELPLRIRGFGPVKDANAKGAEARREDDLLHLAFNRARPVEQTLRHHRQRDGH